MWNMARVNGKLIRIKRVRYRKRSHCNHKIDRWTKMGLYCLIISAGVLLGIVFAQHLLWPLILRLFLIPVLYG